MNEGIVIRQVENYYDFSSPIEKDMFIRQRRAEERENDPTLEDVWDGSTTQPDLDSHQFDLEGEDYQERSSREWEEIALAIKQRNPPYTIEDKCVPCPCPDCEGIV